MISRPEEQIDNPATCSSRGRGFGQQAGRDVRPATQRVSVCIWGACRVVGESQIVAQLPGCE